MQKYDAIEQGIAKKDVCGLREAIGNICYLCRDFSDGEFESAIAYVQERGIALYDSILQGELISSGKDTFTEEDFVSAVFELKQNFCKERVADVIKIGKTLYKKDKASSAHSREGGTSPNEPSHRTQKNGNRKAVSLVALGVVILLAVLTVSVILVMT